jgi:hypothetical protein
MLLKILSFSVHKSPFTVQVLQSLTRRPVQSSKLLLTQSFLVWGSVGTNDDIFLLSRLSHVLKWNLLFEEWRGLTIAGHFPSTGK